MKNAGSMRLRAAFLNCSRGSKNSVLANRWRAGFVFYHFAFEVAEAFQPKTFPHLFQQLGAALLKAEHVTFIQRRHTRLRA
jgi:hypothetical protein